MQLQQTIPIFIITYMSHRCEQDILNLGKDSGRLDGNSATSATSGAASAGDAAEGDGGEAEKGAGKAGTMKCKHIQALMAEPLLDRRKQ